MKFEPTLHKLSNGIAVLLDPMDIETVSMKIRINGGTRIEKPNEYGISHFIEHMLFNGTEKYPTGKITRDILNDNGGARGGSTSLVRTAYTGRILAENFNILLDVLADMILNPNILAKDIEKERSVIIQEKKRSQDDESRKYNWLVNKNIFPDSYLNKYDGLGEFETIGSFSCDDLLKYKNDKYTANNIIIGISGKLGNKDVIISKLENLFGHIKSGKDAVFYSGKVNPSIIYDVRDDKKQTRLFIGFENGYPDERKYDYENMCQSVFDSSLSRRLFENIREKQGLVYSLGSAGYGDRYLGVNGYMTALSPEKLSDVIAGIAHESYDIMYKNPVTIEELNRKNTMIKLGRADFLESSTGRCDKLIGFYASYGDVYNPAEFDVMRAKMTVEDVMKYSADVFSNPLNIIAQGPKCDIDMKSIWEENFK